MDFKKVSRVNYAFFQTDGDGYIFGTDSWADPNVLFGPYDFAPNTDKLPPECKGGRGKDIGKPKNATVDEHAIYNQQVIVQQQPLQGEGGIGNGNNAQTGNRRTQNANANGGKNTYQYPDYTKDPPCKFFEQCHRNFPNSHTCNTHKYKDGLIYIAHTDGAQVYPSIGGWTLSNSFPVVAADEAKRKRFARECVGLIADYGFDGIDIDWEYPGYEPHGGTKDDAKKFQ
jgi:GH18 family chitinase